MIYSVTPYQRGSERDTRGRNGRVRGAQSDGRMKEALDREALASPRAENQDESEGHPPRELFPYALRRAYTRILSPPSGGENFTRKGKEKKRNMNERVSANQCDLQTATPGSVCSTQ